MRFLIDNALSPLVSDRLNELGYDAVHVRDIGKAKALDSEVLQIALDQDRTIVSADTDFATLLALRGNSKPSFVLFRQTEKTPKAQTKQLELNLPHLRKDIEAGCIAVFEDERIRIRSLPISQE